MKKSKFKSVHSYVAYSAIKEFLETNSTKNTENKIPPEELREKKSCFVTLKTNSKKLRGCIGTLYPVYENLYIEIIRNAVASATRDGRFDRVTLKELEKLNITVEVLSEPEKISDISLLNPLKYGLIISDSFGNKGVLLPNIEGIDTVKKQIEVVKRKAGIYSPGNENLNFYRFTTEKFY